MTLEDLGYTPDLENYRKEQKLDSFGVGRVISEHKERYLVKTEENEYDAEIIGNLRFSAQSRTDFPAVGDWVAISEFDEDKALIHAVFPRKTLIERQAVGKQSEKQIIATNIDFAFIVQAVDRDLNLNRLERYLTICNTSRVEPIVVLTKIDLVSDLELKELIDKVKKRVKHVPLVAISNESQLGYDAIKPLLLKAKTYCLLGSSGVGKSTLLNNLSGKQVMKTNTISASSNKGRHVTSHRELLVLENGGMIIDNPGMREVGITDSTSGLEITFDSIVRLSHDCKFKDCTHTSEMDCAVLAAVDRGEIEVSTYDNFMKMEKESQHFESTVAERRKKDKDLGKVIKHFKNTRKSDKY
jgi:ribosome biogenesis GTPase